MKDFISIELKSDLEYCQKKIKLAMAKLEIMKNDDSFNCHDIEVLVMELKAIFSNRLEKMNELEQQLEK